MKNILFVIKTLIFKGKENQSFMGATWVATLLRVAPERFKRFLSLAALSQSPHYFYRHINDGQHKLPFKVFLENEFNRNKESRVQIMKLILAPYLQTDLTVLDYGCGPGFLANAVSMRVSKVLATDVSRGVLECARNLNDRQNISYLHTSELGEIKNGSVDLIYSFAVIQHVTDEVFDAILDTSYNILKDNGRIALHVVVDQEQHGWRSESEWVSEKSINGLVKLKWGLNCFNRNSDELKSRLKEHGFKSVKIQPVTALCAEVLEDDIYQQHLVTALKE